MATVPRYTVLHDYRAVGPDGSRVELRAGASVNMADEHAEWVNRDSPGTLELAEPEPDQS